MKKQLWIGIAAGALLLIALILIYPLFSGRSLLPKITIDLHPNDNETLTDVAELEQVCPTKLRLTYFVLANNTPSLGDDYVFISILNSDEQGYAGSIFINGQKEIDMQLPAKSWTNISSTILTTWWRQPAATSDAPLPASTFYIDVRVKGCKDTISIVTPDNPSGQNTETGGGTGGGGGSGSPIKITKSTRQLIND